MNDDEKGYVTPTPVDTSGEVTKDDSLLGRERDNIIIATNQANNSVDKDMIVETNNKYKIKKTPLLVRFIAIVLSCLLIFFVVFYAVKYSKKFIEAGEVTTTTTTSSPFERSNEYWNKNIIRRYIDNEGTVYFFAPKSYDDFVYTLSKSEDGIYSQLGTYDDEDVVLNMDEVYKLKVSDKGLLLDEKELTISSGEYKYYEYKDDNNYVLLLINASQSLLQGLYIENNSVTEGKYMEYDDKIVLTTNQGIVEFPKEGNNVMYNSRTLQLQN